ncbi:hypothetical protein C8J56DRAFT_1063031 [Mycena floridula]|nr:hypothetical protein C8J56DRAFT_1063031 [Mycena floridula]
MTQQCPSQSLFLLWDFATCRILKDISESTVVFKFISMLTDFGEVRACRGYVSESARQEEFVKLNSFMPLCGPFVHARRRDLYAQIEEVIIADVICFVQLSSQTVHGWTLVVVSSNLYIAAGLKPLKILGFEIIVIGPAMVTDMLLHVDSRLQGKYMELHKVLSRESRSPSPSPDATAAAVYGGSKLLFGSTSPDSQNSQSHPDYRVTLYTQGEFIVDFYVSLLIAIRRGI